MIRKLFGYLFLISLPFYQVAFAQSISLNGNWNFVASNTLSEAEVLKADYSTWDTLHVPGNWDTRQRYASHVGKGYYQRNLVIPKKWKGKQIRIKFEAVYETSKVWLNGELIGEHIGGYLPFTFNLTKYLKAEGNNSLVVMADNTYKRGAWWAWGGISREVRLMANEEVRLVYQHISSVPDFVKNEVNFTIKYAIENNGLSSKTVQIVPHFAGRNKEALLVTVNGNSTKVSELKFKRKLTDYKLWHFKTPNLYELKSELKVNGQLVDVAVDNFGIRKFEVRGEQFFLNNQPVRMNGVNRVHDHPLYGNTEPDQLIERDMKDIKSLGCNFSRLMHAPLSKNLLDFCDKNGFLLIEEIPVWGETDPQAFPDNPIPKKWMADMIERDFNHPSVVAWSVGNELRKPNTPQNEKYLSAEQYAYINSMLDFVAFLDSTRLKTYVSFTGFNAGKIGTEPYEKLDFLSMNSYGGTPKVAERLHQKFPGKPIFVSEIGIEQIGNEENASLNEKLLDNIWELKKLPYITGVSIWTYNDYKSNYRGTPASGFREWGVVDAYRKRKEIAYKQLKDVFKEWE